MARTRGQRDVCKRRKFKTVAWRKEPSPTLGVQNSTWQAASSPGNSGLTVFADPGKYQFSSLREPGEPAQELDEQGAGIAAADGQSGAKQRRSGRQRARIPNSKDDLMPPTLWKDTLSTTTMSLRLSVGARHFSM
jgi:hypothetical protein